MALSCHSTPPIGKPSRSEPRIPTTSRPLDYPRRTTYRAEPLFPGYIALVDPRLRAYYACVTAPQWALSVSRSPSTNETSG
jgi:hypothetical protein